MKDTYRKIEKTELIVNLITLITIIVIIIILNQIIGKIILNPISRVSHITKKIVHEVPIPNTKETRKEINLDIKIDYRSEDEIGDMAESFDFLLEALGSRIEQSKSIFRKLVNSMMNLFGEFHTITKGHQIRTARIASAIGHRLGLSEIDKENLFNGMMLHDIGKVGIDKNVLTKPGRFTDQEREEINRHPIIGFQIAKDFPLINTDELTIIKEHHEKFDGSGYPHGVKGSQLGILSRISSVADILDALSCPRDYKEAKSFAEVKRIMTEMSGKHLDPKILTVLFDLIKEDIIKINISKNIDENQWITIDEKKLGGKAIYSDHE